MTPVLAMIVVGLTSRHLGPNTPKLRALAKAGAMRPLGGLLPALTCSVQATYMTGLLPRDHGVVGNGWLFRDLMEVWFWRQSNHLVDGPKVWDDGKHRDPAFTTANMFWWYNMAASHDIGATPRPIYKADGRKLPDCYTKPASLRDELTAEFGQFPLFQFWGPATTIASSRWIAEATKHVMRSRAPTLALAYLPHLDYDLQRFGPDETHPRVAASLREIDDVAGDLAAAALAEGRRVLVMSEYGIAPVDRPVHINRALRDAGFLAVRPEDGGELLDPVASRAFAVADHQIAHLYIADPADRPAVQSIVAGVGGVAAVLDEAGKKAYALDHPRAGDLVALAEPGAWFTYYYWQDDARAPDFARTVEIHRKPGYDPVELCLDPAIRMPALAIGSRLARRKLGQRVLMDVIPLDAGLVRGSHGLVPTNPADGAVIIASDAALLPDTPLAATDVKRLMLDAVFGTVHRPRSLARIGAVQ
jgi:predicted AlkP superfamily pyrophosphatase or phosphodiesterase